MNYLFKGIFTLEGFDHGIRTFIPLKWTENAEIQPRISKFKIVSKPRMCKKWTFEFFNPTSPHCSNEITFFPAHTLLEILWNYFFSKTEPKQFGLNFGTGFGHRIWNQLEFAYATVSRLSWWDFKSRALYTLNW